MWNHWAVRASSPIEPFRKYLLASWTWDLMRRYFPESLGVVLMPNHMHLILPQYSSKRDFYKLNGILGAISNKSGIPNLWQKLSDPVFIPDRHHLRRQLRYVALNPCRSGLCGDPLEWCWSSYRDTMGAAAISWVSAARVSRALGESESGFKIRFHAYVSGDPSVAIQGSALPQSVAPKKLAEEALGEILAASAAALRLPVAEIRRKGSLRKLFIHLAHRQGWRQTCVLSDLCDITPRAVQLTLKQKSPLGMDAAALCLGDRRLRLKWKE